MPNLLKIDSLLPQNEDGSCCASISNITDTNLGNIPNEDDQAEIYRIAKLQEIKQSDEKHQWRKLYLGRSFYLAGYVLYMSLSFLLFSAIGVFAISDNVLIALLTTMVANVLGVLAIAFYWLYQK